MAQMKSSGWVVVIFEGEHAQYFREVAYVKGPFQQYEQAKDWADSDKACIRDEFEITFLEAPDE